MLIGHALVETKAPTKNMKMNVVTVEGRVLATFKY